VTLNRAASFARRPQRAGGAWALAAGLLGVTGGCALAHGAAPVAKSEDLGREEKSLKAVCGTCHNLQIVMDTPRSLEEWRETMQKMVDRGASGTDDQYDDIFDFLHRTMTTIDVNSAEAQELATVLGVPDSTAARIIARRLARKFSDLADLKTVAGIDAHSLDAKARMIYFQ
jgi:Helix-hairpin-helix motif